MPLQLLFHHQQQHSSPMCIARYVPPGPVLPRMPPQHHINIGCYACPAAAIVPGVQASFLCSSCSAHQALPTMASCCEAAGSPGHMEAEELRQQEQQLQKQVPVEEALVMMQQAVRSGDLQEVRARWTRSYGVCSVVNTARN